MTIYPYPCDPRACRAGECGLRFDGCGGTLDCGTCGLCNNGSCEAGETCRNCAADCGPCPGGTPPPPDPTPTPTPPPPGTGGAPTARPGGPYAGKVLQPIVFDGTASSDPQGDTTIVSYKWNFGTFESQTAGALVIHRYDAVNTYQVKLTVTDDAGHNHEASTTAAISQASGEPYFATQSLQYAANLNRLHATAALAIGAEDAALYTPRLGVLLTGPSGTVLDSMLDNDFTYRNDSPAAGTWTLRISYYYVSKANPSLTPQLIDTKTTTSAVNAPAPPAGLTIEGPQVLWWFGGTPGDSGYPTAIDLSANPSSGPCTWTLVGGADKAALEPTGCSARLRALAASGAQGDVKLQVSSGSASSAPFAVTVATPYKLNSSLGGPTSTRPLPSGYDTVISMQLVDQFNRTVKGLVLRNEFGLRTDRMGNDWESPEPTHLVLSSGTLTLHISQACSSCLPPSVSDPWSFEAQQQVFTIEEAWWASPSGSGGVRVQRDVQVWNRGYGQLVNVTR